VVKKKILYEYKHKYDFIWLFLDNKKILPPFACFSTKNPLPSQQVFGNIPGIHMPYIEKQIKITHDK